MPGFTLIELSIVLVIIGLLVGGVLVGRDLIRAAQEKRLIADIQSIQTAANTFRLKYSCLPGDCANASQFFTGICFTPSNQMNGTGDGMLTYQSTADWEGEDRLFLCHLYRAGLIRYDPMRSTHETAIPSVYPDTELSMIARDPSAMTSRTYLGYYLFTTAVGGYATPSLPALAASNIDQKIDDGNADAGKIVGANVGATGLPTHSAEGGNGCTVTSSPSQYNVTSNSATPCALAVRLDGFQ